MSSLFQRAWSLVQDGDVIPAIALLQRQPLRPAAIEFLNTLRAYYPHQFGKVSLTQHNNPENVPLPKLPANNSENPRFKAICSVIHSLPPEVYVLDFGCAFGVFTLDLAAIFRDKHFVGVDFGRHNINHARIFASQMGLTNITFDVGDQNTVSNTAQKLPNFGKFAAVIASEVLEHTERPWEVIDVLEREMLPGAPFITTVPSGPWEPDGWKKDPTERWHLWHLDYLAMSEILGDKDGVHLVDLTAQCEPLYGRLKGHLASVHLASGRKARPLDVVAKALGAIPRPIITLCEQRGWAGVTPDRVLHLLKGLEHQVQILRLWEKPLPELMDGLKKLWWLTLIVQPPHEHGCESSHELLIPEPLPLVPTGPGSRSLGYYLANYNVSDWVVQSGGREAYIVPAQGQQEFGFTPKANTQMIRDWELLVDDKES